MAQRKFKPPKAAQRAACRALQIRSTLPRSKQAMTRTGLARANQLCKGESVSIDVVRRMAQFERHRQNAKCKDGTTTCKGRQAWLGWGGSSGVNWAKRISKQNPRK